jgi:hypothetical protein
MQYLCKLAINSTATAGVLSSRCFHIIGTAHYSVNITMSIDLLSFKTSAETALNVASTSSIQRISSLNWTSIRLELELNGYAIVSKLLLAETCEHLASLYAQEALFRSRVIMARHGFGKGEYKYFSYPLPSLVQNMRSGFYPYLASIANDWNERMQIPVHYPPTHETFIDRCHAADQRRPTPLLLQYATDDYNCLHQDLYGEQVFPLQVAVLLSAPNTDFTGGELVLTEQRPRMQSRPHVVPLTQGDAVLFPVSNRPVQGTRGYYRVNMRHGVSRLRSGQRHTLGIIFHDAT